MHPYLEYRTRMGAFRNRSLGRPLSSGRASVSTPCSQVSAVICAAVPSVAGSPKRAFARTRFVARDRGAVQSVPVPDSVPAGPYRFRGEPKDLSWAWCPDLALPLGAGGPRAAPLVAPGGAGQRLANGGGARRCDRASARFPVTSGGSREHSRDPALRFTQRPRLRTSGPVESRGEEA